jgi:hypothetical protein
VFHWDAELSKTIGAPYTIMGFMKGTAPATIWPDDIYEKKSTSGDDDDTDDCENDEEHEEKENETKGVKSEPKQEAKLSFYAGFHFKEVPQASRRSARTFSSPPRQASLSCATLSSMNLALFPSLMALMALRRL